MVPDTRAREGDPLVDVELAQGSFYEEPENFLADNTYILHSAVGRDFAMFIDHVTDPVERTKAVLNTEPREDTRMDSLLDEPLKSEYLGLLATRGGKPVPDAGCRSPNRDVPGTLSGSCFFEPDSMSVEPHVAIAGDIDGASLTIVNLGSKP